jgi:phosphatidate phosphatase PAH1
VGSAAVSTLAGRAAHSASDPITNPGRSAVVRAKFAYGTVSKDLEGETVSLYLRMGVCGAWREIASAVTDHDGEVAIEVPWARIPEVGRYAYQLVVRGDLSRAYGTIYVLDRDTKAVVFDIDATLTRSNRELYKEIAWGKDESPRPHSVELVRAYVRAGYLPIFISGRPYLLRESTRAWMIRHGYPPGPLITTNSLGDSIPGKSHVGAYKVRTLKALQQIGVVFRYAYGDASSDVCAYARAGIDPKRTFIFSDAAHEGCAGHAPPHQLHRLGAHLRTFVARLPRAR